MTLNQAFTIISNISGPHVARIITNAIPNISRFKLWKITYLLRRGMPIAKIIHNKWFYGYQFYTNKWTLDPRPDTETLVNAILSDYKNVKHISIADLGTGTGCIICSIAKNMNISGIAIDKSYHAVQVARKNVNKLGLRNKIVVHRARFDKKFALLPKSVDVIVSNPPYIDKNDKRLNIGATHDPKMALFAKNNGFAAYEQIAKNAKYWLHDGGRIYLEIGLDMQDNVCKIFNINNWTFIKSIPDLAGITRVLVFQNSI